jgi:hypothetical protein
MMFRTYDDWKTTDPSDAEYCLCGRHASACCMDEHRYCPENDGETDEPSEEELEAQYAEYVAHASRNLGRDRL